MKKNIKNYLEFIKENFHDEELDETIPVGAKIKTSMNL